MEITFATEELKEICLARAPKAGELPNDVIRALHAYYNALRNADHIEELPFGQPENGELSSGLTWRFDFANGYRVIMQFDQKPPKDGSSIKLADVYRVKVLAIEAHDA